MMPTSRRHFLRAGAAATTAAAMPEWADAFLAPENNPGGNPVEPGSGLCDPQVRVYGDRVYLYATHDASPNNSFYEMHDWWVWTSDDLVHWSQVSTLRPEQTYWRKPSNECWATDAISHNGKYYFYFSRGSEEIGVVEGHSPKGRWKDPLHKPLIAKGSTPTQARDPGILQEPDGTTYIIFGLEDYYIAKLNDDMISLAETPRQVFVDRKMGPYGPGKGDDKPFLHKRNGLYYLSWGCYYAMSDNVYGPYVYKASIITKEHTSPDFQKGLTMDRHGSFFELHGQWYFICNDQSWPGTSPYFRTAVISYVHYRENGEIATVDLNRLGVGRYDADAARIEAKNYFRISGGTVAENADGGFEVRGLGNGSYLAYPNVANLRANSRISFRASSANGATIEIRARGIEGGLLGACRFPATGDWGSYKEASCNLKNSAKKTDIYLIFKGDAGELMRLDCFNFQ